VANAKWTPGGYIPYLQANTGTYGDPQTLRDLYRRCAALPGALMLAIGTRADCLSDGVIDVLAEVAKEIPLLMELGMQTVHDDTLAAIRRGYDHEEFLTGYARLDGLRRRANLRIGLHILNGLPGEDEEMMLATAKEAARLRPDEVKIHTLCVLRGTEMEEIHRRGEYDPMEMEAAVALTAHQLTYLPPQTVIGRIGADAPREQLIAPTWVRNKMAVENALDRYLYENDLWQGKEWK
jgi:radical SAM protein (TIGR01212 family)